MPDGLSPVFMKVRLVAEGFPERWSEGKPALENLHNKVVTK